MDKTYIFSWGGGVNSTAILAMIKLGMLPELNKDNTHIVFADTGAEMPYTYEHTSSCLQPMARDGWKVKVLRPYQNQEHYSHRCKDLTLPSYCHLKRVVPSRMFRWCSQEYKTIPMKNYRKTLGETILIVGIAIDEKHRAKELGSDHTIYPLIEHNIDREGCYKLIDQVDLGHARKSGCYFCPFQPKSEWIKLYREFPKLYADSVALEENANKKYGLVGEITLKQQIEKWLAKEKEECKQGDLFEENRHCLCEL